MCWLGVHWPGCRTRKRGQGARRTLRPWQIYISNETQSQNRSTFHSVKVCGYKQSKQVGWPPADDIRTADERTGWGGSWDSDEPEKRQQKPMDAVEMGHTEGRGSAPWPRYTASPPAQGFIRKGQENNWEVRHLNPLTIKSSIPGTRNPQSYSFTA